MSTASSTSPAASRHGSFSSSTTATATTATTATTDDGSNGHGPPESSYTPKHILVTGGAGFM
jgi:hypothetical protein